MSYWYRLCVVALLAALLIFPRDAFAANLVKGREYVQIENETYVILTFRCTGNSITGDLDYEVNGVDHPATIVSGTGTCTFTLNPDGTLSTLDANPTVSFGVGAPEGTLTVALRNVKSKGKTYSANIDCGSTSGTCIGLTITGISPQLPGLPDFKPDMSLSDNFGTTTLTTH